MGLPGNRMLSSRARVAVAALLFGVGLALFVATTSDVDGHGSAVALDEGHLYDDADLLGWYDSSKPPPPVDSFKFNFEDPDNHMLSKQNVTTWRSTSFDSDEKSPASLNFTADAFTKKLGFYGLALIKPGEGRKRKQDQQGGKRDEGKAAAAVGTGPSASSNFASDFAALEKRFGRPAAEKAVRAVLQEKANQHMGTKVEPRTAGSAKGSHTPQPKARTILSKARTILAQIRAM